MTYRRRRRQKKEKLLYLGTFLIENRKEHLSDGLQWTTAATEEWEKSYEELSVEMYVLTESTVNYICHALKYLRDAEDTTQSYTLSNKRKKIQCPLKMCCFLRNTIYRKEKEEDKLKATLLFLLVLCSLFLLSVLLIHKHGPFLAKYVWRRVRSLWDLKVVCSLKINKDQSNCNGHAVQRWHCKLYSQDHLIKLCYFV